MKLYECELVFKEHQSGGNTYISCKIVAMATDRYCAISILKEHVSDYGYQPKLGKLLYRARQVKAGYLEVSAVPYLVPK